jgi:purine-nucleoside phosphorylase
MACQSDVINLNNKFFYCIASSYGRNAFTFVTYSDFLTTN